LPAHPKLTEADVKRIRRRVRRGARISDLAREHHVNRRTIRRRLDELEQAEAEAARRKAQKRLRRQADAERRKLHEREPRAPAPAPVVTRRRSGTYADWLETPKSLSGRPLAEACGLVRVRNPDGTVYSWREREEIEALLDAGWVLA
jgi:hypothetical protein